MNIYLLSILDRLGTTCCTLGVFALIAAAIATFVYHAAVYESDKDTRDQAAAARAKPLAIGLFAGGLTLVIGGSLLPSSESLRNAYLYVEMSKIATADNAKLTAAEVTKRIDRLIGILDKTVKGGGK